ncbi:hypothetical protein AB0I28_04530 [Phytomonospora sp. NPDC050363]|uniref:hypothetical protein n=1 Tax=Phytomonospora sp. NPDC050363 TaxID=3155642 RepID=UPI0033C82A70
MGAFEEFQRLVSAGLEALGDGFGLLQAARDRYAEAQAELREIVAGGANESVESSLKRLDKVVAALDAAILRRDKGLDEFESYLDQIGAYGSQGALGDRPHRVVAPKPKSGDLEKELAGSDDGDSEMSRKRRIARAMVRNTGDMRKQVETWAKTSQRTDREIEPPPPGSTYPGVVHPSGPDPAVPDHAPAFDPVGAVTQAGVVVVMTFHAVTQLRRKKKEKHGQA